MTKEVEAPVDVIWEPQPGPQTALVTCPWEDVLFGGARGGGKTDGTLGDWLIHSDDARDKANGMIFRRSMVELEDTILRAHQLYIPIGAKWLDQKRKFVMPGGAEFRFRYLERDQDAMAYQGHSYTRVYGEEIGNQITSRTCDLMQATLRSAFGVPCRMRNTANPGGPGHQWVKARYITPAPLGYTPIRIELPGGLTITRGFIPSRLQDNRILYERDPGYEARLHLVGSMALVKAWLDGDWDVVEGAYFDGWSTLMVLPPFKIPKDWLRFRSFDWGYAKPFSVGWWAVADGNRVDLPDGSFLRLPRGAMVRYREWYGCEVGKPNTGLRLTDEQIADGIIAREQGEVVEYGVADPSIFDSSGRGPSRAEVMMKYRPKWAEGKKDFRPLHFKRGENKRVPGWSQMRQRMRPDYGDGEDGLPFIYVFGTCVDSIRTIPNLQHDKTRHEDLDTDMEDHCADEWRYACMTRPMPKQLPKVIVKPHPHSMDGLAPVVVRTSKVDIDRT